ncbi:baeRF3 domain-containing protein [Streptomyces silvisoli]|uniref:Chemotaxis protein n=1 Tax=Streptomyces silvisoli TaxID=3034235 RepID=A0ABT5ZIB8_9ACTN|nr:chemotaxis protein [Streptomyces silvisoli]MDF3288773.1 chemotaxis protein [Streptomyces silvisoli]
MDVSWVTPSILAELRRPREYPAVSLVLPVHRAQPEKAQDPIRLRNLVARARKQAEDDPEVTHSRRIDLQKHLDAAIEELEWEREQMSGEGLVLHVAPGEHHTWLLPQPVTEQVVFGTTFLTRNLVAATSMLEPYWALVLAEKPSRLWDGSPLWLREVTEGRFPIAAQGQEGEAPLKGGIGVRPSPLREERLRRFFEAVDEALGQVLNGRRRPVFLVGMQSHLHRMREVTRHRDVLADPETDTDAAGFEKASAAELAAVLRTAWERAHARRVQAALEALDAARGEKRYAGGLEEAWNLVSEGRGRHLVVDETYRVAARVDGEHVEVIGADGEIRPDARGTVVQDAVDELVERQLEHSGEVTFVPSGAIDGTGLALSLRY